MGGRSKFPTGTATATGYRPRRNGSTLAAAGTTSSYLFDEDDSELGEYAWFKSNSNSQTHTVGEKRANAFGLRDMIGNVWEWCWDGYEADYYQRSPAQDPRGSEQALSRVIRGGCIVSGPYGCRSAYRDGYSPESQYDSLGFRLARFSGGR